MKYMDFIFDPSLVLYLPFHELDGTSFMSRDIYGHRSTNYGSVWTPRGRKFDGVDDYIDIPNEIAAPITNQLTIEAWMWYPASAFDKNILGATSDPTVDTRTLILRSNAFNIKVAGQGFVEAYFEPGAAGVPGGVWNHMVGLWDGTQIQCYLNGEPRETAKAVSGNLDVVVDVWVGADPTFGGRWYLDGLLGELRLYNRGLTPLEIQHNYSATNWRYK